VIALADFEGIAGFRWGALIDLGGTISLTENSPASSHKKVSLVARVINQGSFQFNASELVFDLGKVLIRRGRFGLLLLFCEDKANTSMIDVILADLQPLAQEDEDPNGSSSKQVAASDSSMNAIHSLSLDSKPVPKELVQELLDIYTTFLGPLARVLAAKECKKAGLNLETVTTKQWSKLLNILAARITDEEKNEDFLDRAVMLKTRF